MKIGTVKNLTGLGIHTIRYYERQGLIRKPIKDSSGHRSYVAEDVEALNWISCMKNSGMSLSKIKKYTQAFYDNDKPTCVNLLKDHLEHLHEQSSNIDHYIETTKNKISKLKVTTQVL